MSFNELLKRDSILQLCILMGWVLFWMLYGSFQALLIQLDVSATTLKLCFSGTILDIQGVPEKLTHRVSIFSARRVFFKSRFLGGVDNFYFTSLYKKENI